VKTRLKVAYWNNMPSPYVVARFNEVAQRDSFDFEAWFDGLREPDRSWAVDPSEWKFKARFIRAGGRLGHHKLTLPLAELRSYRPDVFICNYDRLHYVIGAIAGRSLARRTALRCLPSFDAWTPPSRIRDLARNFLFRAVDGAKVPGPDGSAYAGRFGLPVERTWTVTQSIDVAHYAQARTSEAALRSQRRKELGVKGCVFIYVGRIWSGKGLDVLFTAYRKVRAANPDVTLLLVGDGADQQRLYAENSALSDVVWAGFVQPAQLPEIYSIADVMVFPTLGDPNGNGCRLARNQHFGSW
jgi:glycosyltransferase involved in cell wall biosynthesis